MSLFLILNTFHTIMKYFCSLLWADIFFLVLFQVHVGFFFRLQSSLTLNCLRVRLHISLLILSEYKRFDKFLFHPKSICKRYWGIALLGPFQTTIEVTFLRGCWTTESEKLRRIWHNRCKFEVCFGPFPQPSLIPLS